MSKLADPGALLWTMEDIAVYWGIGKRTVQAYRYSSRHQGKRFLPAEDDYRGRTPVWYPATIMNFERPGERSGAGRPKKPPAVPPVDPGCG